MKVTTVEIEVALEPVTLTETDAAGRLTGGSTGGKLSIDHKAITLAVPQTTDLVVDPINLTNKIDNKAHRVDLDSLFIHKRQECKATPLCLKTRRLSRLMAKNWCKRMTRQSWSSWKKIGIGQLQITTSSLFQISHPCAADTKISGQMPIRQNWSSQVS